MRTLLMKTRNIKEIAGDSANRIMNKFLFGKERGGKEIIVEIMLIVVAVVLVIVFRTAISSTITSLVTAFTNKISGLLA